MKTILAVVILIFKLPFMLLAAILKNKALILIAIIAVAVVFAIGYFNKQDKSTQPAAVYNYQKKAPPVQDYPRIVQTSSRAYYIATMTNINGVLTLTNYQYYDSRKWQTSTKPLPLDRKVFGLVQIYDRPKGG